MICKGITDNNYEPLVIKHSCPAERLGKEMTLEEKNEFAKYFLYEAYKGRGSQISYSYEGNIDLKLSGGIRKNIIVRYLDEHGNYSPYDAGDAIWAYKNDRTFPVLALVSLLDMNIFQETGEAGTLLCGDEFCAKMSFKSLIPTEIEPARLGGEDELIEAVAQAWRELDPSIFEKILLPEFNYSSCYVLDILSCRQEYLEYICGKFDSIRKSGNVPKVSIGTMSGKRVVVLTQNGNQPAALKITVTDSGKILDMEMTNFKDDNIKTLSKYELEYRWIPSLVASFNTGNIPMQGLTDIRWWKESLEKMGFGSFEFSFNDIKLKSTTFEDGVPALIYEFPKADIAPLAIYGMVILSKDKKGSYVTLETDIDPNICYLCGQDGDKHKNYGQVKMCFSIEEFKSIVENRFGHNRRKGIFGLFRDSHLIPSI